MANNGINIGLKSYDDLFKTDEGRKTEEIKPIPLSELKPFSEQPFKVLENEDMEQLVESVKENGVLSPIVARPHPEGGYEILSGHRRVKACEIAGITEVPVVIKDLDDDTAIILLVDSNLQREHILPSEKAFAYQMKLEAMKRKAGRHSKENGDQIGNHFDGRKSVDIMAENSNDTDPTEIVQMEGRRRMDYADENDGFTLYIKIPDLKKITQKITYIRKLQEEINKCKQSYVYLMNIIKDGNDDMAKIIRGVFRVNRKTQKYEINYLCEDKLHMDLYHLEHIYALINEGGKEAYCELIAKKFDKEFDNDMIFGSFELRKGELKDFINGYGFPLTYGEFEEFREDFQKERIRLFGISKADNFGSGRKTPASKSINNRLAEIGLGIKIARNDNLYYIENTIEEEIE